MLLKFIDGLIHVFGCNFGLNLLYNDITNDPMCLWKEPGSLEMKNEGEKLEDAWGGPWGVAPLRA